MLQTAVQYGRDPRAIRVLMMLPHVPSAGNGAPELGVWFTLPAVLGLLAFGVGYCYIISLANGKSATFTS